MLFEDTNPRALKDPFKEVRFRTVSLPDCQRDFVELTARQEIVVAIAKAVFAP